MYRVVFISSTRSSLSSFLFFLTKICYPSSKRIGHARNAKELLKAVVLIIRLVGTRFRVPPAAAFFAQQINSNGRYSYYTETLIDVTGCKQSLMDVTATKYSR